MNLRACIAALISCILFNACAHIPIEHRTAIQAHSAFVLIHEVLVFQPNTCMNGADCRPSGEPIYLKVGVGSGGVVDHGDSSTTVLTAKHVVSGEKEIPGRLTRHAVRELSYRYAHMTGEDPDLVYGMVLSKSLVFEAVRYDNFVEFSTGQSARVEALDCDVSNDMCLVLLPISVNVSRLIVSDKPPHLGESVVCASAPFGMAAPPLSVVPYFEGRYSGTDVQTSSSPAHSWFTFPSAPGSSGALILNRNGDIVGVAIGISVGRFCGGGGDCAPMRSGVTIAVPHKAITSFLNERIK